MLYKWTHAICKWTHAICVGYAHTNRMFPFKPFDFVLWSYVPFGHIQPQDSCFVYGYTCDELEGYFLTHYVSH